MRLSIFCSYSHRDQGFRDELERRLSTFLRRLIITGWHDRQIDAGEEWRGQIDSHLRTAHVVVLLISADFLASDYCYDLEIELALERQAQGQAVVIPIIVRPVDWTATSFAYLPVLPSNGKPVISWPDRDQVFAEIAIAIRDIAMRLQPATTQLPVQEDQILTPGLVQMVTVLQLNRLELNDMILNEIAENPVLEEGTEPGEELTPAEVQSLLEPEFQAEPTDPFENVDFGCFFEQYLDPGFRNPASEPFKEFAIESSLSSRITLRDHVQSQLSTLVISEQVRQAANAIIGELEESGYLTTPLEEIAMAEGLSLADVQAGLRAVQSLDPSGVGARDLRECLLLQLEAIDLRDGLAWKIVHDHLKLLESRQLASLAKVLGQPIEEIEIAVDTIGILHPAPGLRYFGARAPQVEPDVYITKEGDSYIVTLNDGDIPELRLNIEYKRMVDSEQEPNKEVREYVKERYASALQLIRNIEQRKQTILRVCQSIVRRQGDFFEHGIDHVEPMMIKDIAEEIGLHPSTVSRAVANKYAHTPHGVLELRYFFSEAVQGPLGPATPLLVVKRLVKRMIEEEDSAHPLTDEQIKTRLQAEGIQVTRRTVAKYREDMKIPGPDQRR